MLATVGIVSTVRNRLVRCQLLYMINEVLYRTKSVRIIWPLALLMDVLGSIGRVIINFLACQLKLYSILSLSKKTNHLRVSIVSECGISSLHERVKSFGSVLRCEEQKPNKL
jgi:hypothetical protein